MGLSGRLNELICCRKAKNRLHTTEMLAVGCSIWALHLLLAVYIERIMFCKLPTSSHLEVVLIDLFGLRECQNHHPCTSSHSSCVPGSHSASTGTSNHPKGSSYDQQTSGRRALAQDAESQPAQSGFPSILGRRTHHPVITIVSSVGPN